MATSDTVSSGSGGDGATTDPFAFARMRPYGAKVVAGAKKAQEAAVAGGAAVQHLHRDEPVAFVNGVRLALFAGMVFWLKLSGPTLLTTMGVAEAVLTRWQRSQVSPRGHADDRRHRPVPIAGE
jgi:hypothetical protein